MNLADAFAHFGDRLEQPHRQTAALASDGSLVLLLWAQLYDAATSSYTDWTEAYEYPFGMRYLVQGALTLRRPVRIVHPDYKGPMPDGRLPFSPGNRYFPRNEVVGHIVSYSPSERGRFVVLCKEVGA